MSEPPILRPNAQEPPIVAPNRPSMPRPGDGKVGAGRTSTGTGTSGHWSDLLHKRWAVLAMLFGATAALGIPFLWKSRGFSRGEKWFWSVVVSLYTVLIFWLFAKVMWWSYTNIRDALA